MNNRGEISPKAQAELPQVFALPFIDENYFANKPAGVETKSAEIKSDKLKHKEEPRPSHRPTIRTKAHRISRFEQLYRQYKNKAPGWAGRLIDTFRHYASWMIYLPNVISMARVPKVLLRTTQFLAPAVRLINGLRLFYRALFEMKEKWTRRFSLLGGLANISFALASLIVPALGIIFVTTNIATNVSLGLWSIAVALKNKYWGPWSHLRRELKREEHEFYGLLAANPKKFEKFKQFKQKNSLNFEDKSNFDFCDLEENILEKRNKHIQLNADLAIKTYNTGILLVALSGIVMCFFPPTLLAGATLLLATAVHGAFFGYDLAGRWPRRVQEYLFGHRATDSIRELEKKVVHHRNKFLPLNEGPSPVQNQAIHDHFKLEQKPKLEIAVEKTRPSNLQLGSSLWKKQARAKIEEERPCLNQSLRI